MPYSMTHDQALVVMDGTGDSWTVEPGSATTTGSTVLRYRHELGYELAAVAPAPLDDLDEEQLVGLLEEVRRQAPRSKLAEAA